VSIEVPAGWEVCPLDDVARLVRGITFPTDVKRHEPQEGRLTSSSKWNGTTFGMSLESTLRIKISMCVLETC
jgi:hypothetical protein